MVAQASRWHELWKPFLNESVGWFIGGFLILVGTLYWVADAWESMSGLSRSFTVFGGAAAWTLGFAAWARFLSRKGTTRAASGVLALIAAAVAPLPPIALGPIAAQAPLLFAPALALWCAFTFFLSRQVARQHHGGTWVAAQAVLTTAVMGLAPLFVGHPAAVWLTALPLGAFIASARRGPGRATAFALPAGLYLLGLFALRLHVTLYPALGTWAPFAAAALYGALHLRRAQKPDAVTIGAVSIQLALLGLSAFGDGPALFVSSALLCATALRLLPGSPRWLYPAYAGAYFAFQTCGQLVPGPLKQLLGQLRAALGYQASQPLPAAYDAVYAAVFVVAGGLFAVLRLRERPKLRAALLTATAWAAALVGAIGLGSVARDPRPALWSAPAVALLCLALGVAFSRRALSWVGAALSVASALAVLAASGAAAGGAVVGALALGLALVSVPLFDGHRQPFSAASGALVLLAVGSAFAAPHGVAGVVALALASAAALLVARNLGSPALLSLAFFVPAALAPRLAWLFDPALVALAVALSGLALALLSRTRVGRHPAAAGWVSAAAAPLLALGGPWLGLTLLVSALALLAGRRAWAAHALGLAFVCAALLPLGGDAPLPFMTRSLAGALAVAASAGASVVSAVRGRTWRAALVASLALLLALSCGAGQTALLLAAVTALAGMRALLPAVGIPLAAALGAGAFFFNPLALVGVALGCSALALLEEWDFAWHHLLGEKGSAWAASLSALALAPVALGMTAFTAPALLVPVSVALSLAVLGWARATRWPLFAAVLPGLLLAPQLLAAGPLHRWLAVLAVAALSRALQRSAAVRRATGVAHPRSMEAALAVGLGLAGVGLGLSGHVDLLPFAVGMLLVACDPAAWRVVAATGFALAVPGLAPVAAVALVALAFAARHSPRAARWVLGDEHRGWTVASAALCAVACAGYAAALQPADLSPWLLLAGCLAAAAVLLGFRWLLTLAVVVLPLAELLGRAPGEPSQRAMLAVLAVAALAALSRLPGVSAALLRRCARLGSAFDGPLATPLWLGAAVALGAGLLFGAAPASLLLAGAALLWVTGVAWQAGVAIALAVAVQALRLPPELASSAMAATGLALGAAGVWVEKRHAVGRLWHHAGWLAALVALPLMPGLDAPGTLVTLVAAAGCAWCLALRRPHHQWLGWLATLVVAHGALFYAGLRLGHGQPHALILPWCALASVAVGAVALGLRSSAQRRGVGLAAVALGLTELLAGTVALDGVHAREAVVAGFVAALAVVTLVRRALDEDDALAAGLAQAALAVGFVAVGWLGFERAPDATAAFAALTLGAVLGGLRRLLPERVARAAALGAWLWPLAGLLAAVGSAPWVGCGLLLAQSLHFAVLGRGARRFAVLAAAAFNGAVALAWSTAGLHHPHYLLIAAGASALVLLRVFAGTLEPVTRRRARACAVALVYAAAAFEPLAMPTPWALWVCAVVCVLGVALGIALRVRSYVFLGTAFLLTTVVASLTRFGIQEPRVGALLLSGLGLLIVGFMVLVTTRRSELLQQYQRARSMLAQWQG